MAGAPAAAAQLGLGEAATSAQLKLLASLPQAWQADAQRVAARFHLDAVGWYRTPPRADHLSEVANAVWNDRRLEVRYQSWNHVAEHQVEPLGLVLKAGEWYVVATSTKGIATYKVANILHVETGGAFKRPQRFDLAAHWASSIQRFEAGLYTATALLRASPNNARKFANSLPIWDCLRWVRRLLKKNASPRCRSATATPARSAWRFGGRARTISKASMSIFHLEN